MATSETQESTSSDDEKTAKKRPSVENPFVQHLNPGVKDIIIFALMSISIAPLRCIATIICSFLIWLLSTLEIRGSGDKDPDQPISNPERHAFYTKLICMAGRAMFFCCGFSVKVVGELAPPSEAPVLVAAPHSTIVDGIILPLVRLPGVVSRIENKSMPLFGRLITFLRPIFVSRAERASRTATIDRIKKRVAAIQTGHPGYNRHLLLFPEGTCTNRSCLITFKPGAFLTGAPVQPIALRFHNRVDTYSWTFQGQSGPALAWFTLCQPINYVTIEFLPVYKPSPAEIKDSYLYAKNVRAVMAERLGIPTTDHTFEDCRLMMFAESKGYPMSAALVEFDVVRRRLGLTYDDLQSMLTRFAQIDRQRRGKISLAELAKHLSLPVIEPVRELFELYDKEKSGLIDFRDFISGLTLVSEPSESENSWKIIFDLFDSDGDGRISEDDLSRLLGHNYGMDHTEIEHLMALMDTDRDGLVSFTDLMNMIRKRPEYNGLLNVYRKMRRLSVSEATSDACVLAETVDVDETDHAETPGFSRSKNPSESEDVFDGKNAADATLKHRNTAAATTTTAEEHDDPSPPVK